MTSLEPRASVLASIQTKAQKQFYKRAEEIKWLKELTAGLPSDLQKSLVSHKGFHFPNGSTARPMENTLAAFEQSWALGCKLCECDIFLTTDGKICLGDGSDTLERLALANQDPTKYRKSNAATAKKVTNMSFKELLGTPLKNGVRIPSLEEVLRVARHIDDGKIIVDLKPGGDGKKLAIELVRFFMAKPELVAQVAAIISFDAPAIFEFMKLFGRLWTKGVMGDSRPLVMLKTNREPYGYTGEKIVNFKSQTLIDDVEQIITEGNTKVDGVYCEFSMDMLDHGWTNLLNLCSHLPVGVWVSEGDSDCLATARALSKLGVLFVNSNLPPDFLDTVIHEAPSQTTSSVEAPTLFNSEATASPAVEMRRDMLMKLRSAQEFDMLVIGGGATGLGVALLAARKGYSVALVERGDFGCGTSSKSSNMIHGGVRYLQAFVNDPDGAKDQIGVVERGLNEQIYMYNSAPFLVRPCPFMVACYSEEERLNYEKLLAKYDELGADDPFPESHWCSKKETLFRFPQLKQDGLVGSWVYYDGQQDDARMALLMALTTIETGAACMNYINVKSLIKDASGRTKGAVCEDVEPGIQAGTRASQPFEVRAKVVINATGPFADAILQMDQGPKAKKLIKPAAGTHIVLPDHFSPDRTGLAILQTTDGRCIFYLPWMGQTIVGTTDYISEVKPFLVPPEKDIDWILGEVNHYLNPSATPATKEDVLAAWCGIRPLAYGTESATGTKESKAVDPEEEEKKKNKRRSSLDILNGCPVDLIEKKEETKDETKSVSREHAVIISDSKMVTITGGKWTSYRSMAQHTIEAAVEVGALGNGSTTADLSEVSMQGLVGTKGGPNVPYQTLHLACAEPFHAEVVSIREDFGLDKDITEMLVTCYGADAMKVVQICNEKTFLAGRIAEGYPWIFAQVSYACRREYATTMPDILSRRTRLSQVDVLAAYSALARIADVMAYELDWTQDRVEQEVREARVFLKTCGLDHCMKHRLHLES